MRAGDLDRRITLRRYTEDTTGGSLVRTPEVVANVWAQKQADRGVEAFRSDEVVGWATVIWRTRWFLYGSEAPTVKWDLLEGERAYEILDVREIGRREGWEFVTRCRAEDQA